MPTTSVSPAVEHLEKRKAQNALLSRTKHERVAYVKHENDFLTFFMDTLKVCHSYQVDTSTPNMEIKFNAGAYVR